MRARFVVLVALALALTICGCGESDADKAAAAATSYFAALESGDAAKACAQLTAAAKKQLSDDVADFGGAFGCVQSARLASRVIEAGLSESDQQRLRSAGKAVVDGTSAEVTFDLTGGLGPQTVALVKQGDDWKVNEVGGERNGANAAARAIPDVVSARPPVVEGKWRVVYTGESDPDEPSRTTWTTTKVCKGDVCGFKAKSSWHKSKFNFRMDKAVGDFISNERSLGDCGDLDTGEISVKDAYKMLDRWTVTPTKSVLVNGNVMALEMTGSRSFTSELTKAGRGSDCQDDDSDDTFESVRFVRVDAPEGLEYSLPAAETANEGV